MSRNHNVWYSALAQDEANCKIRTHMSTKNLLNVINSMHCRCRIRYARRRSFNFWPYITWPLRIKQQKIAVNNGLLHRRAAGVRRSTWLVVTPVWPLSVVWVEGVNAVKRSEIDSFYVRAPKTSYMLLSQTLAFDWHAPAKVCVSINPAQRIAANKSTHWPSTSDPTIYCPFWSTLWVHLLFQAPRTEKTLQKMFLSRNSTKTGPIWQLDSY